MLQNSQDKESTQGPLIRWMNEICSTDTWWSISQPQQSWPCCLLESAQTWRTWYYLKQFRGKKNRLSALTCVGNIVTMNTFLCNIHRENEGVLTQGRRKWGSVGKRIKCARRAGWRSLKIEWIVVHRQHYTLRNFLKAFHRCSCQWWWAIQRDERYFSVE